MYSKYKLPVAERQQLLDEHSYKDIEIRDHACGDVIEKLYYSAGFEPICVYCSCDQPLTSPQQYPQCEACLHYPPVKK